MLWREPKLGGYGVWGPDWVFVSLSLWVSVYLFGSLCPLLSESLSLPRVSVLLFWVSDPTWASVALLLRVCSPLSGSLSPTSGSVSLSLGLCSVWASVSGLES